MTTVTTHLLGSAGHNAGHLTMVQLLYGQAGHHVRGLFCLIRHKKLKLKNVILSEICP